MIQLRFDSMAGTDTLILGPAPFFTLDGLLLRQGPDGTVVGRYSDHHWEVNGRYVSSYECIGRSYVRFEDIAGNVSRNHGPFQHLRVPNGCCYADQILFAELLEEAGRWVHRVDRTRWSAIVISAAT